MRVGAQTPFKSRVLWLAANFMFAARAMPMAGPRSREPSMAATSAVVCVSRRPRPARRFDSRKSRGRIVSVAVAAFNSRFGSFRHLLLSHSCRFDQRLKDVARGFVLSYRAFGVPLDCQHKMIWSGALEGF